MYFTCTIEWLQLTECVRDSRQAYRFNWWQKLPDEGRRKPLLTWKGYRGTSRRGEKTRKMIVPLKMQAVLWGTTLPVRPVDALCCLIPFICSVCFPFTVSQTAGRSWCISFFCCCLKTKPDFNKAFSSTVGVQGRIVLSRYVKMIFDVWRWPWKPSLVDRMQNRFGFGVLSNLCGFSSLLK